MRNVIYIYEEFVGITQEMLQGLDTLVFIIEVYFTTAIKKVFKTQKLLTNQLK